LLSFIRSRRTVQTISATASRISRTDAMIEPTTRAASTMPITMARPSSPRSAAFNASNLLGGREGRPELIALGPIVILYSAIYFLEAFLLQRLFKITTTRPPTYADHQISGERSERRNNHGYRGPGEPQNDCLPNPARGQVEVQNTTAVMCRSSCRRTRHLERNYGPDTIDTLRRPTRADSRRSRTTGGMGLDPKLVAD